MTMHVKLAAAAALLAGGLGLASAAQAAPVGPAVPLAAEGLVTSVAEGCGPGFFRNRRGFCRPMRRGFYGPPRGFGRRCFVRPGRFGPVRVCRW